MTRRQSDTTGVLDQQPKTYRLPVLSQVPVEFTGWLLAEVSSEHDQPGKDRWSETRIYKTTTGKWIVEQQGRTRVPGEEEALRKVFVCDNPVGVRMKLNKKQGRGPNARHYMRDMDLEALEDAAEADPELAPALVRHI
jgi:hypothetical protein